MSKISFNPDLFKHLININFSAPTVRSINEIVLSSRFDITIKLTAKFFKSNKYLIKSLIQCLNPR